MAAPSGSAPPGPIGAGADRVSSPPVGAKEDAPVPVLGALEQVADPGPSPPARPRWGDDASADPVAYRRWLDEREPSSRPLPVGGPVISVVVPVFRPELAYLRRCVESVRHQTYRDWQLCLCDDGSSDRRLSGYLRRLSLLGGRRIRVVKNDVNQGISSATNAAASAGSGAFVALLDQDDVLAPDALAQVADALARFPEAALLYSDEDKIDAEGLRFEPHFKPDWAPELLLTFPYLGHLLVVRRDLWDRLAGLRPEFDGSQDYDLMLRATELTDRIVHLREPLYHWRAIPGSAAADPAAKPWGHDASRRALEDALVRRGIEGSVEDTGFAPGWYHVRRRPAPATSVSIIVPFKDQAAMTARCLESLARSPGHDNYEIVAVDNSSTEPETLALRRRLAARGVRVLEHPGPFNWSAINNEAARSCASDVLVFMNNDIEARRDGWLSALLELAERPDVGAVGARLVFPDGTLQHAGIVVGLGGVAGHVLAGLPPGRHGYFAWDAVVRPYSAVTGACLATRREVFEAVDGFDETLGTAFNDVDYCLRVGDEGLAVLYSPHAELVHHESVTRGMSGWTADVGPFVAKWGRERLWADPLYNPNLDLFATWCPLRTKGERAIWDSVADRYLGQGGPWPG